MQASPLEARATLPAMRLTSKRWRDIVDDSIRVYAPRLFASINVCSPVSNACGSFSSTNTSFNAMLWRGQVAFQAPCTKMGES